MQEKAALCPNLGEEGRCVEKKGAFLFFWRGGGRLTGEIEIHRDKKGIEKM